MRSSSTIPFFTIIPLMWLLLMAAAPNAQAQEPVILCFGDSLTEGFGVPPGSSYPALLQARLAQAGHPHRVVNAGLSGDTTAGALSRLSWAMRSAPTMAIVSLGANDGLRGLPVSNMEENLAQIISRLQAAKVKVILAGMRIPPNYGARYTESFAAVFPRLAERFSLPLIPFLLDKVAGKPGLNLADGIHPNEKGYEIVAETVWQILEGLL